MPDFGIMRGFSEKLFGDKLYAGQLPTKLGLIGSQSAYDLDASAFFDRVATAGGSLSNTEKNAVNQLVLDMKSAGIWSAMKAIYPMIGASAAACAQNLKSSSFTGTFTSGWSFSSNGATPNGTSAYMNTGLNPVAQGLTSADAHLSYYARTAATTSDPAEIANYSSITEAFVLQSKSIVGTNRYFYSLSQQASRSVSTAPIGLMMGSSIANTRRDLYHNGISVANNTSTDSGTLGNYPLYLGAGNISGTSTSSYSNAQCSFASIGNGLNSTQASNFYSAVQTFQTTLSRQV